MNNVIFFVPARQGSKGLVGKNFRLMSGKPLFLHTLDLLKDLNIVNGSVIVSTDNTEVYRIVDEYGFVLDKRPTELAGDHSLIYEVILNAVNNSPEVLSEVALNWIVLLEPTTPMRSLDSIKNLLKLIDVGGSPSFVSVTEDSSVMWYPENGNLTRVSIASSNRQDRPKNFREVGVFYASTLEHFMSNGFFSQHTVPVQVAKSETFDINDIYDWNIVECLINKKNELF